MAGDVDGDGREDTIFVNTQTNATYLLSGGSTSLTALPGLGAVSAVFPLGDINHEGYADFAVLQAASGSNQGQISIYTGGALPSFTSPAMTIVPSTFAQLSVGSGQNWVTYTAVQSGAGTPVSVQYLQPDGPNEQPVVSLLGSTIQVTLGSDANGNPNSTAAQIATAVNASAAAATLVTATVSGDGTEIQQPTANARTLSLLTFDSSTTITAGDFNGDGDADLAIGLPDLLERAGKRLHTLVAAQVADQHRNAVQLRSDL